MEEGRSAQWWIPLASGLVIGAMGVGLAYKFLSNKGNKEKMCKSKGAFSKLYNTKPSNIHASNGPTDASDNVNDMRGYKVNSKGQKTTFFNRELSEEDKILIGDITPKKIVENESTSSMIQNDCSSTPSGGSAWNSAGTWEEKNITDWATRKLKEMLGATIHVFPSSHSGQVSITSVGRVDGDAVVSMIRGKKKYLYDLSTTLTWKVEWEGAVATGNLSITEISADETHEFNITGINIAASDKLELKEIINLYVSSDECGLKPSVSTTLNQFYCEMSKKF